jgi:outer membrane receptor for ferrienterochelin and colicins
LYFLFVDANHDITGNPDLHAEYAHHLSTNLRWFKYLKKTLVAIRPSVYYNDIRDLISLAQVSGESFSYVNVGRYKTTGGTLQVRLERDRWEAGLEGGVTASHTDSTWAASPEASLHVTYLIPSWDMTLNGYYKFNGESTSFALDDFGGVSRQTLAAHHLADVSATKSFVKSQVVLVVGAKNLFDVTRIATTGAGGVHGSGGSQLIAWGRTVFMSLKVKLGDD